MSSFKRVVAYCVKYDSIEPISGLCEFYVGPVQYRFSRNTEPISTALKNGMTKLIEIESEIEMDLIKLYQKNGELRSVIDCSQQKTSIVTVKLNPNHPDFSKDKEFILDTYDFVDIIVV
jgi:hypothetical protein